MEREPYTRTLPQPTEVDQPHWEGLRRHELLIQRCGQCRMYVWYPGEICPRCKSFDLSWERVSPEGEVFSFTTQYQRTGSKFDGDIPYTSAVVELKAAPEVHLGALLVELPPEAVEVGMPVEGLFFDATPDVTILQFRPTGK